MIFYKAFLYSRNSISSRVIFIYILYQVRWNPVRYHSIRRILDLSNTGECQKTVTSLLFDSRIISMIHIHVSGHGSGAR